MAYIQFITGLGYATQRAIPFKSTEISEANTQRLRHRPEIHTKFVALAYVQQIRIAQISSTAISCYRSGNLGSVPMARPYLI
jgi:hypothetical protein